jgi:spermidine/putrescine transport system permease protein
MGYPIAYFITKQSERSQMLLILLITMPMWVNMLIRTYSWISLLSTNGIINNILVMLGFNRIEMLYTDFAVILGMVYNYLPFMIISIHTQLAKMDQSLIQASYDLGANWKQTFSKVIFPLSIPGVMTGITLVFLPAVSSFVIPKLLGGGSYMLIGNLIENQFGSAGNWNFGSAISLIMTVIIIVTMAITKHFDKDVEDKNSKGARQW